MSRLLDDDDALLQARDRELTLSTGSILAIFLGLVLLCALFFGFGYNLGRKSTTTATAPAATDSADTSETAAAPSSSTFDNFKSAPNSAATSPASAPSSVPAVTLPVSSTSAPAPAPAVATPPASKPSASTPEKPARTPVTPKTSPVTRSPAPTPAVAPAGAFVVQIAAVSRKDDADLLVNALHAKGYSVAERSEPQDKLIHIQVGPFGTRRDAEAMREKLIVDGYNAIVK